MASAVTWFFLFVYTILGAIACYPSTQLKETMGPVLMWAAAFLYLFAAFVCLISPDAVRAALRSFLSRKASRLAGVAYIVFGAGLFRVASATELPLLGQVVGFIAVLEGGVQLLLPAFFLTLVEWWIDLRNAWYRAAGLPALLLSLLFAWGGGAFRDDIEAPQGEEISAPEAPAQLPPVLPEPDPAEGGE